MKLKNTRIEDFDLDGENGYRMIIADVVLDNGQVVEEVAEYVNEDYELEYTDSNLKSNEDRLTSDQIYELQQLLADELANILKTKAIDLIKEIITDNISNIDDYDTVQDFLESIKQALCDGEYLSKLDTNEATVDKAYSMLDNNEYELDKGIILNNFVAKSGLKVNFLIDKLCINRTTYYRKIENDFNFSHSELMTIKEVLHLTDKDFLKLF